MDLLESRVGSLEAMVHGGQEIVGGHDIKAQIEKSVQHGSAEPGIENQESLSQDRLGVSNGEC